MSEQSAQDDENKTMPWLAIAAAVLICGVVVTVGLGSVEPPPPPGDPAVVRHVQADFGDWQPFADLGQPDVGTADAADAEAD